MTEENRKFTQREWDREVGWGEVPEEYAYPTEEDDTTSFDEAMKEVDNE